MGISPNGGYLITTPQGTFDHSQGISDQTLKDIIDLLKRDAQSVNKDSEMAQVDNATVTSIFIFAKPPTPPGGKK
jgi:hypothetical protein